MVMMEWNTCTVMMERWHGTCIVMMERWHGTCIVMMERWRGTCIVLPRASFVMFLCSIFELCLVAS